jgi:hypothetical protein
MLRRILIASFFPLLAVSCCTEPIENTCSTPATIKDLTGLDGCGFVFELEDGTRLEPYRVLICGTPPLPKEYTEDPLYNFQFADGKKVMIDYEILDNASTCMAGKVAKITCIHEISNSSDI